MERSNIIEDVSLINIKTFPKVLYFTAKWCKPCQTIQPYYKALSLEYTGINFFKIDVDEHKDLAEYYNITSMPTFFFLKNYQEYKSFVGANPYKLDEHIKYLAN